MLPVVSIMGSCRTARFAGRADALAPAALTAFGCLGIAGINGLTTLAADITDKIETAAAAMMNMGVGWIGDDHIRGTADQTDRGHGGFFPEPFAVGTVTIKERFCFFAIEHKKPYKTKHNG
jgi:hypothetical protein